MSDEHDQQPNSPKKGTSGIGSYGDLIAKFEAGAVADLQPLDDAQIQAYIAASGEQLVALGRALAQDAELREMARSPLMLSVISLVYQDVDSITLTGDRQTRHHQIFAAYVERAFAHRTQTQSKAYTREQTTGWLSWLARRMVEHEQPVFQIEGVQPEWLQTKWQRRGYRIIAGLIYALIAGLIYVLITGLIAMFSGGPSVGPELASITIFGLIFGLLGGMKNIETTETARGSWQMAKKGLVVGLGFGMIFGQPCCLPTASMVHLFFMFVFGLMGGLTGGLFFGRRSEQSASRTKPNQGIWLSLHNAAITGVSVSLILVLSAVLGALLICGIGALAVGLRGKLIDNLSSVLGLGLVGLSVGLSIGLVMGAFVGPFFGILYGGDAFIRHFLLRAVLTRAGYMPWRYADFLDHAAELILLRKVGGGYIFIHRALLEYFASLDP